ncbi:ATP-dependent nuclease [Pseudomonas veronii]|uniref:ATP-dependent nuclease n=1 Tax=Pseudomonas veronii TaxID=76761 RepID=UPI0007C75B81|nr:AAA family ATPase [Pseudomonas veronii]
MQISFEINNVQHINAASFLIDTDQNKLTCIVGKNGAGKTTLIKAIRNFCSADTFSKTSSDSIFSPASSVIYRAGESEFQFTYDDDIRSINCRSPIPDDIKALIEVELPMPHGQRFNFFQSISSADSDIRRSIVLSNHSQPTELIEFLADIYGTRKFDTLVEIEVKKESYYCLPLAENRYIREDYLSSGEYFLISLYRKIKSKNKLIVIDEIDISLDAAAQARLIENLRGFCKKYEINVLFTTHSLAMMRTLRDDELFYMEEIEGVTQIRPASYNYIKSILFGFKGWDKYILTEDEELKSLIEYVINKTSNDDLFFRYKIIPAGGADNVIDLMERNALEHFLTTPDNVITILDGDKKDNRRVQRSTSIYCTPIRNIESALFEEYKDINFPYRLPEHVNYVNEKSLFAEMTRRHKIISVPQLHNYIYDKYEKDFESLSEALRRFLSPRAVEEFPVGGVLAQVAENLSATTVNSIILNFDGNENIQMI